MPCVQRPANVFGMTPCRAPAAACPANALPGNLPLFRAQQPCSLPRGGRKISFGGDLVRSGRMVWRPIPRESPLAPVDLPRRTRWRRGSPLDLKIGDPSVPPSPSVGRQAKKLKKKRAPLSLFACHHGKARPPAPRPASRPRLSMFSRVFQVPNRVWVLCGDGFFLNKPHHLRDLFLRPPAKQPTLPPNVGQLVLLPPA